MSASRLTDFVNLSALLFSQRFDRRLYLNP
jgi:hypothetical protein